MRDTEVPDAAAEDQALRSSPPTTRRPRTESPGQADAAGPSNDRVDAARQSNAEHQAEAQAGPGGRVPNSNPTSVESPENRAADAGGSFESD